MAGAGLRPVAAAVAASAQRFKACRSSSRRTARSSPSISTGAIWCGRRRTAIRPTASAIIRRCAAQTIPKTGQSGNVGVVVTKTLVIAGDPIVTTTPEHPRGAMLRAYDKTTGKEVGAVWMPAQQSGSPMTYMVDGKQYIIVAVSGGNYSGEYIAYTLPASAQRSATGQ